jgi:hypothetical protein
MNENTGKVNAEAEDQQKIPKQLFHEPGWLGPSAPHKPQEQYQPACPEMQRSDDQRRHG